MITSFILVLFILTCAVGEEPRFGCPEADVAMGVTGTWFQYVPYVASWEDCGRICALTTVCKYWTWGKVAGSYCYLYDNDYGIYLDSNYVSGEFGCPEDQGCKDDI